MNKDYLFKILYDNGVERHYKCIDIDEITLSNLMSIFSETFFRNAIGVAQLPNGNGGMVTIDVSKVTYVDITEITTKEDI